MNTFTFKASHYAPLYSDYFWCDSADYFSWQHGAPPWLYVSPLQQIISIFNKTEVGDYTVDCVGIESNASHVIYFNQHAINKASSDTKDKISNSVRFCRRQ